jgi:hypothetical protein
MGRRYRRAITEKQGKWEDCIAVMMKAIWIPASGPRSMPVSQLQ